MNSEGLLAVKDEGGVHLLSKDGALVRSIGKEVLFGVGDGIAFDMIGNVWVTDRDDHQVTKLSQDGQLLQTILYVGSDNDHFNSPAGVSVSTEGMIYICDYYNHLVAVHDEEGKFLFTFGSEGSGSGCFDRPHDVTFGSDGLVYVTEYGNERVCVWSKEGTFQRDFKPKYAPTCIAATSDNHLLITSYWSNTVMVYTLEGELVHEFGGYGSVPGRFIGPRGICVDDDGLVYVADSWNSRVQIF